MAYETLLFLIGFFLGSLTAYMLVKPIHDAAKRLDEKYCRLLAIIQQWQRKL